MTKLNLLIKTPVTFQKGPLKIVEVAFTKVDTIFDGQSDGQMDTWEKCLQNLTGGDITVTSRFQERCIFDLTL